MPIERTYSLSLPRSLPADDHAHHHPGTTTQPAVAPAWSLSAARQSVATAQQHLAASLTPPKAPRPAHFASPDLGGDRETPAATDAIVRKHVQGAKSMGTGAYGIARYIAPVDKVPTFIKVANTAHGKQVIAREHAHAGWAHGHGLGPAVRAYSVEDGLVGVELAPGAPVALEAAHTPAYRRRLCALMVRLHEAPLPGPEYSLRMLPPSRQVLEVGNALAPLTEQEPTTGAALKQLGQTLVDAWQRTPAPLCPIHADLHGDNILDDGNNLQLIDFAETGVGDPAFDMGYLARALDVPARDLALWTRTYQQLSQRADPDLLPRAQHALALVRLRFFAFAAGDGDTALRAHYAGRLQEDLQHVQLGWGA